MTEQIGRVVIGQQTTVRALLAATFAEGHTLIVGVPGLAKTLLVRTLADVLGWSFRRVQFTPDMMPADIIGMELLDEDEHGHRAMRFVPGPVFGNLILADEINRTPPKTQAALL
ncbi:MAG: AAA family ATPase, partial [Planctomycetota bacterium]